MNKRGIQLKHIFAAVLCVGYLSGCQTLDNDKSFNAGYVQQQPVELSWLNSWSSRLALVQPDGEPQDLSEWFKSNGSISFDLKVNELDAGDLRLMLECGEQCQRPVELTGSARTWADKSWQQVSVPADCFAREGDDFARITAHFVLEGAGTGNVVTRNISFSATEGNSLGCVMPKALPVTPAPLNAHWALEWWMPRHKEKLARVQQGDVDLVMIGDSITHGWEDAGRRVWDEYFASRKSLNLGFSGDRTENVLWRLENGEVEGLAPKVAVLMIGTNNAGHRQEPPEYTAHGVATVVDQLKTRLPATQILVLGIFPRGENPSDPLRQLNQQTNEIISNLAKDERVTYLNINEAFLDENGELSETVMPDLLHPNEAGYRIWAEAMEPVLAELLREKQ